MTDTKALKIFADDYLSELEPVSRNVAEQRLEQLITSKVRERLEGIHHRATTHGDYDLIKDLEKQISVLKEQEGHHGG